ncbi:MAG: ribonuclease HII [Clostridiales bacterium]|jgi:ribonuclease HII|nr:ribonuclease HII [Clostridiales bacterium]
MNTGVESLAELPLSALQNSAIFKNKGKIILTYEYEKLALNDGFKTVCGIDEAGRGPLAGPVFAAAVILPMDFEIEGLNDSKKLTQKKREQLFDIIVENAVSYSIATATEMEIDEINILKATFLAMNRAVDGLEVSPDIALIDGNQKPGLKIEERTMIKGDAKSVSIAAASILAKVSRDRYMIELSKIYPQYFFEKHKGYGTKLHYEMLEQHGISQVHRRTFLKKLLERE